MRIFILQKSAVGMFCRLSSRDSCKDAFQKLQILTLPSMYIYETILYCLSKCHVTQGCEIHNHETRLATSLRTNQHRSEMYSKLPSQAGAKLYNKLPIELKHVINFNEFKIKLKHYLLTKTFYSVDEFTDSTLGN